MQNFPKSIPIKGRVRAVLKFLTDEELVGKNVVDIGSTFGWLAKEISDKKLKSYVGIEPNNDAVTFSEKQKIKNSKFIQGFAEALPVKSNSTDIVTFFDVYEHVNNEEKSLKEISRILKKNGSLLLTTPFDSPITKLLDPAWYLGHRHYNKGDLRKMLSRAGLEIETFEIKGGIVSLIYMLLFYVNKWIFGNKLNLNYFMDLDDKSYTKPGIATVFLKARKE